ncbi:nitroreductase family protein [Synechococcus sp. J7-Johnson]|uniref:nitroreductase family protein n=1 Tax=Synechococcus sp. J7-Johnson TaxID=2823737 RepID=UPI0020CBFFE1|nr:nitroreductase family protein [Synechococcus sp. J7-Johnson]
MTFDSSDLLQSLAWRYATKQFDAERRIPSETWAALDQAMVLTPSSFGLQPWTFLVIDDPDRPVPAQ